METFNNFYPLLKNGGVYVIEDIHAFNGDVDKIKSQIDGIEILYSPSLLKGKIYKQPFGVKRK